MIFLLVPLLFLTGCYQAYTDHDLRTVSVTNNPHIIHDDNRNKIPGGQF